MSGPLAISPVLRAALDEARAELDAGLGVPAEAVWAWVESWDTDQELPMLGSAPPNRSQ